MDGINFVTVKNRVLVFPKALFTSVIVKKLYVKEIELERFKKGLLTRKAYSLPHQLYVYK